METVNSLEEAKEWFLRTSEGSVKCCHADGSEKIVETYPDAKRFFTKVQLIDLNLTRERTANSQSAHRTWLGQAMTVVAEIRRRVSLNRLLPRTVSFGPSQETTDKASRIGLVTLALLLFIGCYRNPPKYGSAKDVGEFCQVDEFCVNNSLATIIRDNRTGAQYLAIYNCGIVKLDRKPKPEDEIK